jgi:Tfp pilus assembly protein PilZ
MKIAALPFMFILMIHTSGFSQKKPEYPEIFEIIKEGDQEKSYTLLLDHQKNNPEFANTYFQLGIIAHQWAFDFNPFTDYEFTKLFIYNTKLYFNLAKHKLADEKKKNYDYYLNAIKLADGEKLSSEMITAYIDKKNAEIIEYEQNIIEIIKYFKKSSDKYNECVTNFMTINAEYNNVKNLYLTDNDENNERIKRLKTDFDSVLVYFDLYKQALSKYPLKGYNQTYQLKDIVTFRLDGLTASNFLNNEIVLWNYKKWVEEVKLIQEKVITSNKDEITVKNEEMTKLIDQLSDPMYSDTVKGFKTDDKFIYKIEKFDNNSFLLELFKLNESIINYLILVNKEINDPKNINEYSLVQIASFALSVYEEKRKVENLNENFEKRINPDEIKKYRQFYMTAYNGMQGLRDYSFRQKLLLNEKKDFVFDNLREKLYHTSIQPNLDSLSFNKQKINLRKTRPVLGQYPDGYQICDFKYDKNDRLLFSGYYKNSKNKLSGFSGFKLPGESVPMIVKTIEKDTSDLLNLLVEPCNEGFFAVQTSIGKDTITCVKKFTDKGKEVMSRVLPYKKIPRYLFFDDINNTVTILFNGSKLNPTDETDDEQIIYSLNPDDILLNTEQKFYAKANTFDVLKLNNRYLLFSNYSYYLEKGEKLFSSNTQGEIGRGILITVISAQGQIEKQIPLDTKVSVLGLKAVKNNSDAITILGYKTTQSDYTEKNIEGEELFWMIIDSNVEPTYIGWHD